MTPSATMTYVAPIRPISRHTAAPKSVTMPAATTRGARPHDRQPFHIEADCSERNEAEPEPSAGIGDGNRRRREHRRGDDAHQEIVRPLLDTSRRGGFVLGHDPVFTARPPKRRSRLAYSAIALSSASLSKSGQWIGTNTSSL